MHEPGHDADAMANQNGQTKAKDPVCGMSVEPNGPRAWNHAGVTYDFCSDRCRARFEADGLLVFLDEEGEGETNGTSTASGAVDQEQTG